MSTPDDRIAYLRRPQPARRDAVTLTMTPVTARTLALALLDPEGVSGDMKKTAIDIAEKLFVLSERSPTDPVAFRFEGYEIDEINDTMTAGQVAIVMLDRMARADLEHQRLASDYGVEP